ncbi:hypothetical protein [Luteithermobacter gelatinilyticus]|uniref:hypothetical protein n=1 Tax=Luteithermobacter gelatinilyticus TaxID=2582913 RepID=UPI0011075034|nr:hypothetical protein [Luteithermobacter gelatinilyticus]
MEEGERERQNSRVRNRGIRASRVLLEKALSQSDLEKKTQIALANRIADLEGLEAAPKDLVNKVFRERPVDPQTLERIARALGVEARDLYLEKDVPVFSPAFRPAERREHPAPKQPAARRQRTGWPFIFVAVALLLGTAVVWGLSGNRDVACRINEFFHPLKTPDGRLGIIIARFAGDPGNVAQASLVSGFLNDPKLGPYVSVLRSCDRPSLAGPGDISSRLEMIRKEGRERLHRAGAHILLWGHFDGERIRVRFISGTTDLSPVSLDVGGRPAQLSETRLEVPVSFSDPGAAFADIKKLTLDLMKLETPELRHRRQEAVRSYRTSMDWLRASILGDRNVRRQIDAKKDPQLWALINGQLCYKQRLLGDYDADITQYLEAQESCRNALAVRDRAQYPRDWATLKINLASVLIRLHLYADSPAKSLEALRQAEALMAEAGQVLDRAAMPQLWALQRRNMGVVFMRLGELSTGAQAESYFERGLELMEASLTVLDPEFQPVDWAMTQQNMCASLYRKGYNQGAGGVPLVVLAEEHCREALRWLDPENTALTWAMVQNNLAVSQAILAQLEQDPDRLAQAIDEFRKAQRVYTRDAFPSNWAEVEINLGELHCNLAVLRGDPSYLETAIAHSEQALEILMYKKMARYQRYLQGLLTTYRNCQRDDISRCVCAPG